MSRLVLPHVDPRIHTRNGRRVYEVEGVHYPSVTTILKHTKVDGYALKKWKSNATAADLAEVDRKRDAGAARGRIVHDVLENYWKTGVSQEQLAPMWWASLWPLLQRVTDPVLIESAIWHPLGFAGTVDALVYLDGKLTLLDWKTAAQIKLWAYVEDYRLQATAYAGALSAMHGIQIEQAVVAVAIENVPAQEFTLDRPMMRDHWNQWHARVVEYYVQQEAARAEGLPW